MPHTVNVQQEWVPDTLRKSYRAAARTWERFDNVRRLWEGDETLWRSSGESEWLGWLTVAEEQLASHEALAALRKACKDRYTDAVLLGMGGSSLCTEVLRHCFGARPGYPNVRVLDSTDPDQVLECQASVNLESTLLIMGSKSGATMETDLLGRYFFAQLASRIGESRAGQHCIAITDPGSRLEATGRELGFRHVLPGVPSIGGRYSALSNFGMVPAAVMGLDTVRILVGANAMTVACADPNLSSNPALRLGLIIGLAAREGRDKLSLVMSQGLGPLGPWIEQLVAESAGKAGTGIVPIEGDTLHFTKGHGSDHVFVVMALNSEADRRWMQRVDDLVDRGHPVVRIVVRDVDEIGREFVRWEFATAVAGAVLGINPFDQPEVELAKSATRRAIAAYEKVGSLPKPMPFFEDDGFRLYAPPDHAKRLIEGSDSTSVAEYLAAHLATASDEDYIGLLAFLVKNIHSESLLGRIRGMLCSALSSAVTVGFGPRFLHSTGQLHKGGPNSGVFVQIACDQWSTVPIPDSDLNFGLVQSAQALGDFEALSDLGRRVMRVEVKHNREAGLAALERAFAGASRTLSERG